MFWRFESGTLLNLNAFEKISVVHDSDKGLYHVKGQILNQPRSYNLFSGKDEEHVHRVLIKICDCLESERSIVRESWVRLG